MPHGNTQTHNIDNYRVGGASDFYDIREFNKKSNDYFRNYSELEKEIFEASGMTATDVNEYELVNEAVNYELSPTEILIFWQREIPGRSLKEEVVGFPEFAKNSAIDYLIRDINSETFVDEFARYPSILKEEEKMDLIYEKKFWPSYRLTPEGKDITRKYFAFKGIDPEIKILNESYINQMKQHLADIGIIAIDWLGVPTPPKDPHEGMIKVKRRDGEIEWRQPL